MISQRDRPTAGEDPSAATERALLEALRGLYDERVDVSPSGW